MSRLRNKLFGVVVLVVLLAGIGCQSAGQAPSKASTSSKAGTSLDLETGPDSIELLSTTIQPDFPHSLTFGLACKSKSVIDDIELHYKIMKRRSAIVCVWPDLKRSREVKTSWMLDTRKISLPPGARIKYKWIVENVDGDVLRTKWGEFAFQDLRYDWQELSGDKLRLFWYRGSQEFARSLLSASEKALERLAEDVRAKPEGKARIYVYASSSDLRGALVFPQEWTGGVAFTDYDTIAIGISPTSLPWGRRALAHELTHLVVHQMTFGPFGDLPTWLDEGLAVYAQGELRANFRIALKKAVSERNLISLQSLTGSFPTDPQKAILAYAESFSIVKFLIDEYGSDNVLRLLQVFKEGSTPDKALRKVYGFGTDGLERRWRASLGAGCGVILGFGKGLQHSLSANP